MTNVADWAPGRFEDRAPTREEARALAACTLDQIPPGILRDVRDDYLAPEIAAVDVLNWEPERFEKRRPSYAELRALRPYPTRFIPTRILLALTDAEHAQLSIRYLSEQEHEALCADLRAIAAELPDELPEPAEDDDA